MVEPLKPLAGVTIVEMAGLAPAPFAAMMLADHGARVIRVERPGAPPPIPADKDILRRNRAEILTLDLRDSNDHARLIEITSTADGLIEGFRPGVMERLGFGPEALRDINPALVYGRITGYGQTGPLAGEAGHDIDYLALSGNLASYGPREGPPTPPANAIGDFGGGGMMLAFAMVAAILAARESGEGVVIDCAMVDGAALLAAQIWSLRAAGLWRDERESNLLDGGAAFYRCYRCSDGAWIAIGAIEPQFFEALIRALEIEAAQGDADLAERLERLFATRPREHWLSLVDGKDTCLAPVLTMAEAPDHPHNRARGTFGDERGFAEPRPAPRFWEI